MSFCDTSLKLPACIHTKTAETSQRTSFSYCTLVLLTIGHLWVTLHILEQSRQSQCVAHSDIICSKTTEADSNSLVKFFQISFFFFFLYKLSLSEEEELTFLLFSLSQSLLTFLPNTACSTLPVFSVMSCVIISLLICCSAVSAGKAVRVLLYPYCIACCQTSGFS